jgi:lipoprotein NlpI
MRARVLAAALAAGLLSVPLLPPPVHAQSAPGTVTAPDDDPSEAVVSARPADRARAAVDQAEAALGPDGVDAATAIAGLDKVLADPRLTDRSRAKVLAARAMVEDYRLGDDAAALVDIDKALALDPGNPAFLVMRGGYHESLDQPLPALLDYSQAAAADPDNASALHGRGRVSLGLGRFQAAAQDLGAFLKMDPENPYAVIELHMARLFLKEDDAAEFAAGVAASQADPAAWPSPIFDYFQGRIDAKGLMAATVTRPDIDPGTGRPRPAALRRCEAVYYLGMDLLAKGRPAEARPLLAEADATCPHGYTERSGAHAPLARLAD